VGPYQINYGSPHNLLGAHQVRNACLPPRLQGALRQGVRGPLKAPENPPWLVDTETGMVCSYCKEQKK
jgi:hypothetical protein